ncbi:FecR family protein [Novosphingobium sp.]|uniref:FecR family protein n=1 Tax=Novosphingobium sp. TaxID=1874826 RepID=UPI002FDD7E7A
MNQNDALNDDLDPLMKEALQWLVRLTSGSATTADAREFEAWRAQGAAHEEAFREAATFRKTVRAMNLSHPAALRAANVTPIRPRPRPVLMNRRAMLAGSGAIAASAAAVMVANPPLGLWPSFAELTADYRTGQGERRDVKLAGGASIDLNARSALSVINDGHGISLVSGEAFVDLPETARPFLARAGGEHFASQGGTFNIRTSERETCVTCLSGAITRESGGGSQDLRPGEQLVASPSGETRVVRVDPERISGWRQGLLVFRNTPLAEAVEDINRYRSARIILTSNDIGRRQVNGIFHTDQIENAVAQIQQLLHLGVRELPGGIVLMG